MNNKTEQLIFGRHPVIDAIKTGASIDKLLIQQGIRGEFEKEVRQLSKQYNIPLQTVPKERMAYFTKGNHQGIIGFLSLIRYYSLDDVLPTIYEKGEVPLLLLLDGVTDIGNFGAIARSAVCGGVHALVIPRKGVAQINADALKASAGALMNIPVCRESSLVAAVDALRLAGIQVLASDLQADKKIMELDFTLPTAIIMGAEGEGVNSSLLKEVDDTFIIPQRNTTNSFNVSVASGIILYESLRQRVGMEGR